MNGNVAKVLIGGQWRESQTSAFFQAENPATGETLPARYPISPRAEALEALRAGAAAAETLRTAAPASVATFLENYASAIESRAAELVEMAHAETGLAKTPRLKDVELPRTTDQLRQAARAAREGAWEQPVRDEARKIFSVLAPLGGPVVVMGPNNFPFAYNSVAGGDFASAIAARNPVIAKANPGHPGVTRLLAELAWEAARSAGLPESTIQLLYGLPPEAGLELVAHPLVGATGFTGSKESGLQLKAAADRAGKPIYLEMSSINPVILLEGALQERGPAIVEEFFGSCLAAAGQFCTSPGLVILPSSSEGEKFLSAARAKIEAATPGVLLGKGVRERLVKGVEFLRAHGAEILGGGHALPGPSVRFANTVLRVSAETFLKESAALQTEAFGPVSLFVFCRDAGEMAQVVKCLAGNLTGSIYAAASGADDQAYAAVEPALRVRVGRLLNDKMPTGVAVSPAMNHGGPFPATGHPGFTAVGFPASIQRFAALQCYDNVPPRRLPAALQSPS
ncbi:MAG TPA: aldehyde dehydrogenase family protein [Verrucomicrobiae bacterium]|jgi:NADP-dependent aldehyde dehydrogenase|nr:aldehyde dehydrogenase family protein [Verrucomicrobiae bacterium]